jgi:hypothetical protein
MSCNVAEMTAGKIDQGAYLLTAARINLNLLPKLQENWGQIESKLNGYHSDMMMCTSTF